MGGSGLVWKRCFSSSAQRTLNDVVIVGAARTPMGSFRGTLSSIPGPRLGALAIQEALKRAQVEKESVQEVYMGSVLPADMGQAPDRQAAIFAGIPDSVPCTLIRKRRISTGEPCHWDIPLGHP